MQQRPLPVPRRLAASALVALAVSATALVATILVFFVTNGAAAANLGPLTTYFLPAAIALVVLLFGAAVAGAFRSWWGAGLAGLAGGILASVAGTAYTVLSTGTAWSQEVTDYLLGSLAGTSLVFEVAAVVAALTVGRAVWRAFPGSPRRPIAIVRVPADSLENGELTHLERTPVDSDLAQEQWDAYVSALETEGFEIVQAEPADEHPDSVFIEDVVVMFGDVAVITSPGADSRAGEIDGIRELVESLGHRVEQITRPGTLDGGDVLKVGSTVYVGRGGRTNGEGIRQLRAIVAPLGYTVIAVPITKALHLKSAVTALPDGTVIGFAKYLEAPSVFERFLPVPEAHGAAVVVLGPDAVLLSSAAPKTKALLEDLGYRVVTVDVSEFEKLEGCVTCLSVRIR
ncbi:dimethylargininase [Salinibacterium soli]|uniref:Dimethylarginine dimethylaminohydrolase n=1 Tax=Antiquaquibacter soli TaxID=3064523 RepID=A0ABT9BV84_9MICO|nr:dimethylargininase [Protaetiibacter sp. WY-16]MDO7883706.1 dimethylarginine dimethylaminohydrolase [Protaetiibacter sp. WY-16]